MRDYGVCTMSIEEILGNTCYAIADYKEGVLIDNYLLYDSATEKIIFCKEEPTTTWTSAYRVYIGDETEMYDFWDNFCRKVEKEVNRQ